MKKVEQLLVERILEHYHQIDSDKIVGIYPFGSVTYDTQTESSDYDFVVIVDMNSPYIQYESKDIDIHIMSIDYFESRLVDHDIQALEVYFNPMPIMKYETEFELVLPKLRHKISAVTSNSWVKAKKKVMLDNEDDWIGYKSLFHAMRIMEFGIQLARDGEISDFKCSSYIWDGIKVMVANKVEMSDILAHFKPIQNAKSTEFRKLAPKE